jgi:hypothetical protein
MAISSGAAHLLDHSRGDPLRPKASATSFTSIEAPRREYLPGTIGTHRKTPFHGGPPYRTFDRRVICSESLPSEAPFHAKSDVTSIQVVG